MTGHDAAKPFLDQIDVHERELAEQAEQIRAQIEELTARLAELDTGIENLQITRKTLRGIAAEFPSGPAPEPALAPPAVPEHPAYQQILTVFADVGGPLRARDLCQALNLPIIAKNTEGIRSKLKRLASRGILTEPEAGLF
ncbi:hypothetical protein HRW12_10340 [Streptomyces lunaelactis]|nr:hypothetical protein [Streptomyces lunaelactis]NUK34159.1 hypothetical protein [Streptomyces lunaelactis]